VTLHVSSRLPLAQLVVRAASAARPTRAASRVPRYSPPSVGRAAPVGARDAPEQERVVIAEGVLRGLLSVLSADAEVLPSVEAAIAPDAVVWSPALYATSRDEVLAALGSEGDLDGSLSDAVVRVVAVDVIGERVYIEWRLTARFARPCLIDDDLLVEPTGRLVETSGVQVATFRDGLLGHVSCYYDDLGLLEQMVT
jgi:hypothetical protein